MEPHEKKVSVTLYYKFYGLFANRPCIDFENGERGLKFRTKLSIINSVPYLNGEVVTPCLFGLFWSRCYPSKEVGVPFVYANVGQFAM